ncbi:hypothetical protein MPSEU_000663100 [Mayamaea pseudoterrestris]|nr:hypothetical protein MPSEU_000663100 [Mayamaea pseudoterrestris]
MATRGIFQLQKLSVYYCEHGGSSTMLRKFIASGRLSKWASDHPHVEVSLSPRNGKHPFVQGNYKTCSTIQHQVTVKNYETQKDIQDVLDMLHSRSGRKITKITTPVLTDTPSIQGVWTPFLALVNEQPKIKIHASESSTTDGAASWQ